MSESQEPSKTPWNQKLFNLMMQEHDVICTESDMDAIIQVCREIDPSRPPQPVQPAEPVEGAPALERLIFLLLRHAPDSGITQVETAIVAARAEAANRRPSTGEDERVAVLLSRLDAVCCILAIVDGPMPTKQELGMAYDELVSVRDDVAGIIRHLPAPSHSDIEPPRVQLGYDREGDVRCYAVRRGDVLLYSGADPHAAFMAALNGDSK